MEIKLNPKTGKYNVKLNETDMTKDRKIRDVLESEGWSTLRSYYEVAREELIERGKDGIRTRAKVDLSANKWAILKGFDEFLQIPERIMARLTEYEREQEQKEGEERAAEKKEDKGQEPIDEFGEFNE